MLISKGVNVYKNGRTFRSKKYAELKRRFMEEHYTNEFFVEEVNVETEIERLQKENSELKRFERMARCSYQHVYGIGMSRGYCNKCGWMQSLSEEAFRECLAKLGER